MVWNKALPQGATTPVNLVDDDIRANNDALELALDIEHSFATGGIQNGRHAFGFGTMAARDAISALLQDGALWFETGGAIPSGFCELQVRDQSGLVDWLDGSGRQFLQLANEWTAQQRGAYTTLASSGSVSSDWAVGNAFEATLTGNITLLNPSNKPAVGKYTNVVYVLEQGGAGNHVMSLDAAFDTPYGVAPVLSTGVGDVDVLVCTLLPSGQIMAQLIPDVS